MGEPGSRLPEMPPGEWGGARGSGVRAQAPALDPAGGSALTIDRSLVAAPVGRFQGHQRKTAVESPEHTVFRALHSDVKNTHLASAPVPGAQLLHPLAFPGSWEPPLFQWGDWSFRDRRGAGEGDHPSRLLDEASIKAPEAGFGELLAVDAGGAGRVVCPEDTAALSPSPSSGLCLPQTVPELGPL